MKANLYYRAVFRRQSMLNELVMAFFLYFCSYPRLILEVFIRKNFGERYFSFFSALMIALLLILLPMAWHFTDLWISSPYQQDYLHGEDFFTYHMSWYIFIACFVIFTFIRESELGRLPSVFDFARFSLSTGEIHPLFWKIRVFGKTPDVRTIETILEPALFLIIGAILWKFDQGIGVLIVICSIFYSIGYMAAYHQGDNFVMDKIDEMICSEELVSSFVEGKDSSETRGVHYYGRRPADPEVRRKVADSFLQSEDVVDVL